MIRALAAVAAGVMLVSPLAVQAQAAPTTRLADVMSAAEQHAAGLDNLSPAQRAALDAWLTRYTATVAAGASYAATAERAPAASAARSFPAASPGMASGFQGDTLRPASGTAHRHLEFGNRPPRAIGNGARILRAAEGSSFILLADGTMWEIFPEDRPGAVMWQAGDFVQVRQAPIRRGRDFEYLLVNGAQRGRASARFAGWVRAGRDSQGNGQSSTEPEGNR
ncbi:MAG TPA: hypothetical protein VFK13_04195 [Gemmatimonadaceae bacterium]|nr:hypothetical protein [Gemmatimonadaceae bacterium]